jgi:hypothetical protein
VVEVEGGRVGVGISNYNRDTVIDLVRCRRSFTRAVEIAGSGGDASVYPKGITIKAIEIDGTDAAGTGVPVNRAGILIQSAEQIRVGYVKIASLAPGAYAGVLGTNIKDVQVGDTQLPDNYDAPLNSAYMSVARRPDVIVGRALARRPVDSESRTVDRSVFPSAAR